MRATSTVPVPIDRSCGPQPYLDIDFKILKNGRCEYTCVVRGRNPTVPGLKHFWRKSPDEMSSDGALWGETVPLYTVRSTDICDRSSIAILIAREMAKDPHFCFGRDSRPYRWAVNHWELAYDWLGSLDYSMRALIRTPAGETRNGSLYSETLMAYRAWSVYPSDGVWLRAFGSVPGIPLISCRVLPADDSNVNGVLLGEHRPENMNLCFLNHYEDLLRHGFDFIHREMNQPEPSTKLFKFLRSSLSPDQLVTVQRWFGYHLVVHQVPNAEKMLYLWGPGANGKSQILWLLRGMLGKDACADLRLSDLRNPAALELLIGKLAMIGAEASTHTDRETLKALISREPLNCNPKYRMPFTVQPECLVTQSSNQPPEFDEASEALSRRIIALHMPHVFEEGEGQIQDLAQEILDDRDEAHLLLNWALEGAFQIIQEGRFTVPSSIQESSKQEVSRGNPMEEFLSILEFGNFEVSTSELFIVFDQWSKTNGYHLTGLNKGKFLKEIGRLASKQKRNVSLRTKAKLYTPQRWLMGNGNWGTVDPKLPELERYDLLLGVRVAEGQFGGPIGQIIPEERRDLPLFAA